MIKDIIQGIGCVLFLLFWVGLVGAFLWAVFIQQPLPSTGMTPAETELDANIADNNYYYGE